MTAKYDAILGELREKDGDTSGVGDGSSTQVFELAEDLIAPVFVTVASDGRISRSGSETDTLLVESGLLGETKKCVFSGVGTGFTGLITGAEYFLKAPEGEKILFAKSNSIAIFDTATGTTTEETVTSTNTQFTKVKRDGAGYLYIASGNQSLYYKEFDSVGDGTLVASAGGSDWIYSFDWGIGDTFYVTLGSNFDISDAFIYKTDITSSSNGTQITSEGGYITVKPDESELIYSQVSTTYKKTDLNNFGNGTLFTTGFTVFGPNYSPDGTKISYTNGGNVWVKNSNDGLAGSAVTNGGAKNDGVFDATSTYIYYPRTSDSSKIYKTDIVTNDNGTLVTGSPSVTNYVSIKYADNTGANITTTQPEENAVKVGTATSSTTLNVHIEDVATAPTAPFGYTLVTSLTWDNESTVKTANLPSANNKAYKSISNVVNTANPANTSRVEPQINTHTNYTTAIFTTVFNVRSGSRIDTRTAGGVHRLELDINSYIGGSGFISINGTTDAFSAFVNGFTGNVTSISYTPVGGPITGRVDIYEKTIL